MDLQDLKTLQTEIEYLRNAEIANLRTQYNKIQFPMKEAPKDTNLQEFAMDKPKSFMIHKNCIDCTNALALTNINPVCAKHGSLEYVEMDGQEFVTKDSGKRQEFESGMVRDVTTGKLEIHRVAEGPMLERWGGLLTRGGVKYPDVSPGIANWTLANGEAEYQRFRQSAFRHFFQWWNGQVDEDHAAAVFFNINGAEYTKAKINSVPTDLHDLRQG